MSSPPEEPRSGSGTLYFPSELGRTWRISWVSRMMGRITGAFRIAARQAPSLQANSESTSESDESRKPGYKNFKANLKSTSESDESRMPGYTCFKANSKSTSESDESRMPRYTDFKMPGYKIFKEATNNFSIQRKLGRDYLGEVYKAHLPTGETVAVRLLYHITRFDFDDEHFSHCCTQLMSANHKNLVRFLGYSYEEEEELLEYNGRAIHGVNIRRLIGFEYVPGGSLANFLSDQNLGLNWDIRFKIVKGICEGLQYLHGAGIMHFDLNPDDILLDGEKVPKITNYGWSQVFHENYARTSICLGTSEYMPPEYINWGEISKGHDIFSLGVVIKRIVAGTMDYSIIADMDGRKCVEHVHKDWRKRLKEIRRYP